MTLSGERLTERGYPDGRTRRRGQEPAEPPQVRGISVGFSASTTGTRPAASLTATVGEILRDDPLFPRDITREMGAAGPVPHRVARTSAIQ